MPTYLSAPLLAAVRLATSNDPFRPALAAVRVEPHPDGALLVATNGHYLVCVLDRTPAPAAVRATNLALPSVLVKALTGKPASGCRRLLRVADTGDASLVDVPPAVTPEDPLPSRELPVLTTYVGTPSGLEYPDWRRVVAGAPGAATAPGASWYNPEYLATLGRIGRVVRDATAAEKDKYPPAMRVEARDVSSPARVRWQGVPDAFGILMPVRQNRDDPSLGTLPTFFTP